MKTQFHGRLVSIVVGVLTLVITASALFSLAQQGLSTTVAEQLAALEAAHNNAWAVQRDPHPACPHCFRIADGGYGIFEEVPGSGIILTRDIPDPAPLQPGEVRPDFDPETGEPLWYKGNQPYAGPTDEEPVSAEAPYPKIELKRIKARHERWIFSVLGVNLFGISEKGFVVGIDSAHLEKNSIFIPADLEGIPVEVIESEVGTNMSHQDFNRTYRPVPVGVVIYGPYNSGTLGPHIVRDEPDLGPGNCCQILSLTAGHIGKPLSAPPLTPNSPAAIVYQGVTTWGTFAKMFQNIPCGTASNPGLCNSANPPTNDTRVLPEVAAIAHINTLHKDPFPRTPACKDSPEPVRRMQYGISSWVHGPTGVINVPGVGTELKMWGAVSDAPKGKLRYADVSIFHDDYNGERFCFTPVDIIASITRAEGDSGALVATDGGRKVVGVAFSKGSTLPYGSDVRYIRADFIQNAFRNAGMSFHHYWGTDGTASRPSTTQYDNPCN